MTYKWDSTEKHKHSLAELNNWRGSVFGDVCVHSFMLWCAVQTMFVKEYCHWKIIFPLLDPLLCSKPWIITQPISGLNNWHKMGHGLGFKTNLMSRWSHSVLPKNIQTKLAKTFWNYRTNKEKKEVNCETMK